MIRPRVSESFNKPVNPKKDLLDRIDEKIQDLNLLKSALQNDRSRKAEALKMFEQEFQKFAQREN